MGLLASPTQGAHHGVVKAEISVARALMEVDADAALDGFLSSQPEVRKRSSDALQRREKANPAALVATLAARVVAASAAVEARALAAVLLRKVLVRNANALLSGSAWKEFGLGEALLEVLAPAAAEPTVRRHAVDAVAAAASILFARGHAWPEFELLLAEWCQAGRSERTSVLQILEHLRDVADGDEDVDTGKVEYMNSAGVSLRALLAFLQDRGGALRSLLAASLQDGAIDETSRDAAARIYVYCATCKDLPDALRVGVQDLAPVLAGLILDASSTYTTLADADAHTSIASSLSETCIQAVALAARSDPHVWAPTAGSEMAALASVLATVTVDPRAIPEVRSAALAALLELCSAAIAAEVAALDLMDALRDTECAEATAELVAHSAAATASVLAELPSEDATEAWAEAADDGDTIDEATTGGGASRGGEGRSSIAPCVGGEALFDDALDAAERLISRGGAATESLRNAANQLLSFEAWQARHGALMLHLRLAACQDGSAHGIVGGGSEGAVVIAVRAATQHFSHRHPRVRWAALEVWVRLLTLFPEASWGELFGEGLTGLLDLAGPSEPYVRVRRRGLLVLVAAASCSSPPFSPNHVESLFNQVLLPRASDSDPAIREACWAVAQGVAVALGVVATENMCMEDALASVAPRLLPLWRELVRTLSAAADCTFAPDGPAPAAEHDGSAQELHILWPADWR